MPEGPSLVILKEAAQKFEGQRIIYAEGNAKIDLSMLENKKIKRIRTWGKHFLICFDEFTVRIHMLMFGSYSIDGFKENREPRLSLVFKKGSLTFYTTDVRIIMEDLDNIYDWKADVMSDEWDPKSAKAKLKALPGLLACDALMDQQIFSGVGNIIKNEVLYRVRVHPASIVSALPAKQLNMLIKEARQYSFDFLEWKKLFVLSKNWEAYDQKWCKRCDLPMQNKIMGKSKRRTFFCPGCQVLYK